MMFLLGMFLSCQYGRDCSFVHCSCAIGEGSLLVEDVKQAQLRIIDFKDQSKEEVVVCDANEKGVRCSFTPKTSVVHLEVMIEGVGYPFEIQTTRKTTDDCCSCEYYEFSPNQIQIQYR